MIIYQKRLRPQRFQPFFLNDEKGTVFFSVESMEGRAQKMIAKSEIWMFVLHKKSVICCDKNATYKELL